MCCTGSSSTRLVRPRRALLTRCTSFTPFRVRMTKNKLLGQHIDNMERGVVVAHCICAISRAHRFPPDPAGLYSEGAEVIKRNKEGLLTIPCLKQGFKGYNGEKR